MVQYAVRAVHSHWHVAQRTPVRREQFGQHAQMEAQRREELLAAVSMMGALVRSRGNTMLSRTMAASHPAAMASPPQRRITSASGSPDTSNAAAANAANASKMSNARTPSRRVAAIACSLGRASIVANTPGKATRIAAASAGLG